LVPGPHYPTITQLDGFKQEQTHITQDGGAPQGVKTKEKKEKPTTMNAVRKKAMPMGLRETTLFSK